MSDLRKTKRKKIGQTAAAAASLSVLFIAGLNMNAGFAKEAQKIPVIAEVAEALTFRDYRQKKTDMPVSAEIPSIEEIQKDLTGMEASICQEIYNWCKEYADEALSRAYNCGKAFLLTGGTQQEWMQHNVQISVGYEIKSWTQDCLSVAVKEKENWISAYTQEVYYNLNLKEGGTVSLEDILGEDYVQIANESIRAQMSRRTDTAFWGPEQGGFTTVSDSTKFYVNEDGKAVVVFGQYEIAPGSAGQIEFEITGAAQSASLKG